MWLCQNRYTPSCPTSPSRHHMSVCTHTCFHMSILTYKGTHPDTHSWTWCVHTHQENSSVVKEVCFARANSSNTVIVIILVIIRGLPLQWFKLVTCEAFSCSHYFLWYSDICFLRDRHFHFQPSFCVHPVLFHGHCLSWYANNDFTACHTRQPVCQYSSFNKVVKDSMLW